MLDKVLTVVYLAIGLYCIYIGVSKKGKFYDNERIIEEKREEFNKFMSRMMLFGGILLAIGAILELLGVILWIPIICYSAVIVLMVVFVSKMRKCMSKE